MTARHILKSLRDECRLCSRDAQPDSSYCQKHRESERARSARRRAASPALRERERERKRLKRAEFIHTWGRVIAGPHAQATCSRCGITRQWSRDANAWFYYRRGVPTQTWKRPKCHG